MKNQTEKYLKLLAEKYPTREAVCREIIQLSAILNLPKGTEHFMSDLHGEYEAFLHIVNNCSGVIKEKVTAIFGKAMSSREINELCTLIYYPREKMALLQEKGGINEDWYRLTISRLIEVTRFLSSKYTRSKVRKALPPDFAYIIDEFLHVQKDEDDNQVRYHREIMDTIISLGSGDEYIEALCTLIKRLAVDHVHIVGDIFDRGGSADKILDLLMKLHSLDIEWGNHDILWMGAACGSEPCIANALRNNLKYHNVEIFENAYGISLRNLTRFAAANYPAEDEVLAAYKAMCIICFKLEGQVIRRHPEYQMDDRLLLEKIDVDKKTVLLKGREYPLKNPDLPTLDPADPYRLSPEEEALMKHFRTQFLTSPLLQKQIGFLYEKGSMYRIFNGNLLFHGCVPMDAAGNYQALEIQGNLCDGKEIYDRADQIARRAFFERDFSAAPEAAVHKEADRDQRQADLDFMWFLWGGEKSPLCGRKITTFERYFIEDQETWHEDKNEYYNLYHRPEIVDRILHEFGLYGTHSHVINGHTPVRAVEGENPVRADGKLIVIDGGFNHNLHDTTGIAGYTLIYNSHGIRIKAHQPFESVYKALEEDKDIESDSTLVEVTDRRVLVADADNGKRLAEDIEDLKALLSYYTRDRNH